MRESLFSLLDAGYGFEGAAVLDLFGGSGAFSFESLSRGAKCATILDTSADAISTIRKNAASLGVTELISARKQSSLAEKTYSSLAGEQFDFIFADPPYAFSDSQISQILQLISRYELLGKTGAIVLERERSREISSSDLEVTREKTYGGTAIQILEPKPQNCANL